MITEEHYRQLDKMIATAIDNPDLVTEWELDFLNDWASKLEEYSEKVRVSDKQHAIFDKIAAKLTKAGV